MPNDRLRDALMRNGFTPESVALAVKVDPKTVERWITKGRTPYPKHRSTIAGLVRESENYLWPDAVPAERKAEISNSEIVSLYSHRHSVPANLWDELIGHATEHIEILVYAGMFLMEDPTLIKRLRAKGEAGTRIRMLFGDPASREVARRSEDEGIGKTTIGVKIRNVLAHFHQLDGAPGIEIRCHNTTLYNSIYRFDDEMIVNTHVYGFTAPHAPTLHLRRLSAGDLFETYFESFDSVWNVSKPPKW